MTYDRTRLKAKFFDRERNRRLGAATLTLLKEDNNAQGFKSLLTLDSKWGPDEQRGVDSITPLYNIADVSTDFASVMAKADGFVIVNSNLPTLNGEVHKLLKDRTQPPAPLRPYWAIFGQMTGNKYTP